MKHLLINRLAWITVCYFVILATKLFAVTPVNYYNLNPTGCDASFCYHDETDSQLTDGVFATTPYSADLGNGNAYEWVGWTTEPNPAVIFEFDASYTFTQLTIGTYKSAANGIVIVDSIAVSVSSDGLNFGAIEKFKANGFFPEDSQATESYGLVTNLTGKFLKVEFQQPIPSGTMIFDEISFVGSIYTEPTATFSVSDLSAFCGATVTLDASASTPGDASSIINYDWDFDGDFSPDASGMTVSYTIPSTVSTIGLRVENSDGVFGYDEQTFTWNYVPGISGAPVADAGGIYEIVEGNSFELDGSGTIDPAGPCGDILSFEWDLNGDGISDYTGETVYVDWFDIDAIGYFYGVPNTITLTVTDAEGLISTATTTYTVLENAPVAQFTVSNSNPDCAETINFDATTSFHPNLDGLIIQYDWDLDGDGSFELVDVGEFTSTSFGVAGLKTINLRVLDDWGNVGTATNTITVSSGITPPIADAGGSYTVNSGNDVQLDGSASVDPDSPCGSIVSYTWDLDNDGIFGDAVGVNPLVPWSIISSLGVPSTYTISLKVTDSAGDQNTASTTLEIYPSGGLMACFDGNSRIEVPNLIDGKSSFTIETWFNYTDNSDWRWIYGTGSGFVDIGVALKENGNTLRYHGKTNSGSFTTGNGTTTLTSGTWYHLAYVFDGTTWTGYVNGVQDFQSTLSGTALTSNIQAFGQGFWGNGEGFYGNLDELRIWNYPRLQSEIQADYDSQLDGTETGLSAYYSLDQASGPTIIDFSPNANHGTFVGTECLISSTAPMTGSGIPITNNNPTLQFTGNTGYITSIVEPQIGSSSTTFVFEIDYFDIDGDFPASGYPKLYLDFEGDENFSGLNDLNYVMIEHDLADTDVTDGKRYVYFLTGLTQSMNWKSKIIAQDVNGGTASTSILSEPNVSNDLLDISIYADDISFSDSNPEIGETIDVFSTIHNNSAYNANNFVVSLFAEDTFLASQTVSSLSHNSQTTITWSGISFSSENYYPMKVVIDSTDVLVEDNELNNFAIRPLTVGSYVVPGSIVVTAGLSPSTAYPNQNIRCYGNAQYSGVFGSDFDVSGATVNAQIVETGANFSAYTNANGDFSFYFNSPSPGTYTIIGTVTDYTLTGSFGPLSLTILPPPSGIDLISNISLSGSLSPYSYKFVVGTPINGTATVSNTGNVNSTPFSFNYYGEASIASQTLAGLNAGTSQTYSFTTTYTTVGTSSILSVADATGIVTELSESNNDFYRVVTVLPNQPDMTPSNNNIYGNHNLNLPFDRGIRIDNLGGVATGTFDVMLYDDGVLFHTETITNINPCENTSFTVPSYFFSGVGTHVITVKVDEPIGSGVVSEWDETNNVYTGTLNVYQPNPNLNIGILDLDVSPATPVSSGDPIDFIATIRNNGEDDILPGQNFDVDFTVSGEDPTVVYTYTHTTGLAVGSSTTVQVSGVTPTFGSNTLSVSVDAGSSIAESNELDNVASYSLCWEFELGEFPTTTPMFWERTWDTGSTVPLTVALYNYGLYTGTAVETQFFVDGVYAGTETENGVGPTRHWLYEPPYATGQNVFYTFPTAGIYEVRMVTDFPDDWLECNQNNDTLVVSVTVVDPTADLRILSQHISPTELNPDVGEPVAIYLSYENIGSLNTGPFSVRCSVDDVQLGSVISVPGIAAGEDTTVAVTAPWSSSLAGTHVIRGFVDWLDDIVEADELNNEASRAIIVGDAPNLFFASLEFSEQEPSLGETISINASIVNEGDLDCDADVIFYYVNDLADTIQIGTNSVTIPNNDTISTSLSWSVLDTVTTIVCEITNSDPTEYNYDDNEITADLGPIPYAFIVTNPDSFEVEINVGNTFVDTLFVENTGNAPLLYTLFSASELVSESKSSGTVAPSSVDTVLVTFGSITSDVGNYYGTIVLDSNDDTNSQVLIPVTMNYHGGSIAIGFSSLNFGNLFNGMSNTEQIEIENVGDLDLTISGINFPTSDFTADTTTFVISPGGSQFVDITWNPTLATNLLGTVSILSDDFNDPTKTFTVLGSSVAPAYFFNFDFTTNLPMSWNASSSAGNNWELVDDGSGNKSVQISGSTTTTSSATKSQNKVSSLVDASFESATYDFTNFTSVTLSFYHDYILGSEIAPEGGFVEVSTDGGTTYSNQIAYYNSSVSGNEIFNISALVSGQDSVKVRFRYAVTNGGSWTVDDIFLGDQVTLTNVAPTQVQTVVALTTTTTSFEIGWSASYDMNFDYYEIYYDTDENFVSPSVWSIADDPILNDYNTNNTTVTDVFPTTYFVKIRGVDLLGNEGAFSTPIEVSMQNLITDLRINPIGNNQIQLSWSEVSNPELTITGYNVYRGETPDFIANSETLHASSVTDEDAVTSGIQWIESDNIAILGQTNYYYTVKAIGVIGTTVAPSSKKNIGSISQSKIETRSAFSKKTVQKQVISEEELAQRRQRKAEVKAILTK